MFRFIIAHPPNTINGRFCVTKQGEMMTQNVNQVPFAKKGQRISSLWLKNENCFFLSYN